MVGTAQLMLHLTQCVTGNFVCFIKLTRCVKCTKVEQYTAPDRVSLFME